MIIGSLQPILKYLFVLPILLVWSAIWKGLALWRASRLKQVGWYIALLVVNTLGIFEIIYLIATRKKYQENNGYIS